MLVSDLLTKNASVDIKVGDRVRVKPSITTPKHNWGRNVTHKSVGVVKGKSYTFFLLTDHSDYQKILKYKRYNMNLFCLDIKGDDSLVVDFPGHANWKGMLSEMERVTNDDEMGK